MKSVCNAAPISHEVPGYICPCSLTRQIHKYSQSERKSCTANSTLVGGLAPQDPGCRKPIIRHQSHTIPTPLPTSGFSEDPRGGISEKKKSTAFLLYRFGPSSKQNERVNVASSSKNSVANASHQRLSLSCKETRALITQARVREKLSEDQGRKMTGNPHSRLLDT